MKASEFDKQKSMKIVKVFNDHKIRFVAIPVIDDNDHDELSKEIERRITNMIIMAPDESTLEA